MSLIKIQNKPIVLEVPMSEIAADIASGVSTFTVKNITGFAINQLLLIGELGSEGSEIVKVHAVTAPTGFTITLATATVLAHYAGDKVYLMVYDQVEFSNSATLTGSKSVLATQNIWPDSPTTEYLDTLGSTGYYFVRFKNSISATFSSYSDGIPVEGAAENTVGAIIDYALLHSNVIDFDTKITPQFCYDEITSMLRFVQGKQKRQNKYQKFNEIIGHTTRGVRLLALPDDIYDPFSTKSLLAVRIGSERALRYKDPLEFEDYTYGEKLTTVNTQAIAGDTTLVLDNGYEFDDSGTVYIYIAGVQYSITYTGITRATGTLTGIPASGTGSITVTIPAATNAWQKLYEGQPVIYTVRNEGIEFAPTPSDLWDNKNVYADYWTEAQAVDSDGDTIDVDRFDMTKHWLTWKMRMISRNDGKLDYEDGDYKMFADILNDQKVFKGNITKNKMRPKINGIFYGGYGRTRRRSSNNTSE